MNLRKILRIAVIVQLLPTIGYMYASNKINTYLPVQLQDYKMLVHEQDLSSVEYAIMMVGVIALVGYVISSIGLFFIQPWAKWTYVTLIAVTFVISPFTGPMVEHALSSISGTISGFARGATLYMLFFTDVISKKKKLVPPIE